MEIYCGRGCRCTIRWWSYSSLAVRFIYCTLWNSRFDLLMIPISILSRLSIYLSDHSLLLWYLITNTPLQKYPPSRGFCWRRFSGHSVSGSECRDFTSTVHHPKNRRSRKYHDALYICSRRVSSVVYPQLAVSIFFRRLFWSNSCCGGTCAGTPKKSGDDWH